MPVSDLISIRPPAVAGYFYPGTATELRSMIKELMSHAHVDSPAPRALIAPHAGYVYSGPTAAIAYKSLEKLKTDIKRVILLGPAHRVYIKGLALSTASCFATPLGQITIDAEATDRIKNMPQVIVSDTAHEREHSLEVHLPFLQYLLEDFTLLPLVVGETSPQDVADVLDIFWGDDETLIVISSDLSHYHEYETARKIDAATTHYIEQLELEKISSDRACGCRPVRGMLQLARNRNLSVKTLDVRNSGDTAGTKDRVVGYGAWSII